MNKKSLILIIFFLVIGLILTGCPKKTVMKEEPSTKRAEELAAERARSARLEAERAAAVERAVAAERAAKEARERELAKERELEKMKEEAAKREFEKSLMAKRTPGIEGEVFESYMLKNIHFDFDRYNIRPGDAEILQENATLLKKYSNVKIQIEGHCDERGTVEYNLALGERRANGAKNYLISLGISPDRISTISYGEEKPVDPGHHEEAWAKNRRAHFVILSK